MHMNMIKASNWMIDDPVAVKSTKWPDWQGIPRTLNVNRDQ